MNPDWIFPNWPAPPHVKAVFTSRGIAETGFASKSGVSQPPFDAFNLGDHVGDDPNHVMANRHMLQVLMGAKPVYLKQVHGTEVVTLRSKATQTPHGAVADACITTEKKLACTIMVADCLPVLFTDLMGTFVAAAHAGWRGLADGVLNRSINAILEVKMAESSVLYAYGASEIVAWLGPCIGSKAFEVGSEVRTEFAEKLPHSEVYFKAVGDTNSGKYLADLAGLARLNLQQLGIPAERIYGNDSSLDWCTVNNPLRFFSHRRDAVKLGSSGRMAGCVWLE
jgi:YfiH family protein